MIYWIIIYLGFYWQLLHLLARKVHAYAQKIQGRSTTHVLTTIMTATKPLPIERALKTDLIIVLMVYEMLLLQ